MYMSSIYSSQSDISHLLFSWMHPDYCVNEREELHIIRFTVNVYVVSFEFSKMVYIQSYFISENGMLYDLLLVYIR